ncbi:MAG: hypothetical protein JSU81_07160, partial [Candidatus Coatesbacteria bacterium]
NVRGCSWGFDYRCYVLTDGSPPRIWGLRGAGFEKVCDLPLNRGAWGFEYYPPPEEFWVTHYDNSHIYRLSTTGSLLSSFRCPKDHPADIAMGVFSKINDVAVAIPDENLILYMTTTGSVVSSEPGPGSRVTAAALALGDEATHTVYTCDGVFTIPKPGGLIPDTFGGPGYYFVWVTDMESNSLQLWQYDPEQPVLPASLGRLKALFW